MNFRITGEWPVYHVASALQLFESVEKIIQQECTSTLSLPVCDKTNIHFHSAASSLSWSTEPLDHTQFCSFLALRGFSLLWRCAVSTLLQTGTVALTILWAGWEEGLLLASAPWLCLAWEELCWSPAAAEAAFGWILPVSLPYSALATGWRFPWKWKISFGSSRTR